MLRFFRFPMMIFKPSHLYRQNKSLSRLTTRIYHGTVSLHFTLELAVRLYLHMITHTCVRDIGNTTKPIQLHKH